MQERKRAVFLDRDGVITKSITRDGKPYAPTNLKEFEYLPKIKESIDLLRQLGFALVVVTNQPDLTTRKVSQETLDQMHQKLLSDFHFDSIEVCPHIEQDACLCRKPKSDLLLNAAQKLEIDLKKSYMVGDRWRDVSAGTNAGCKTFFIDYGYSEKGPDQPDCTVQSLWDAALKIKEWEKNSNG